MTQQSTCLPSVVSIDPKGASELDDAIAVTPLPEGGWMVDVCLPDVPRLIPPESGKDGVAREAGVTRYLPGGSVQRMLPGDLVERLSLSPDEDRPMVHVAIHVEPRLKADVVAIRRIDHRTAGRLSYPEADVAIVDAANPHHHALKEIWRLASVLHEERAASTGARFDLSGRTYTNEEGQEIRLDVTTAHRSNMAVMEIMILANATLGAWARDNGRSVLYRNHRISGYARGERASAALELAAREGLGEATARRRLRSMDGIVGTAELGTEPLGHHGLDVPVYGWFTSPLRRYCDVVNLRAILDNHVDPNLATLVSQLSDIHRTVRQDSSSHHAKVSRRQALATLGTRDESTLDRLDVHTVLRAFAENPGFDRNAAFHHLARRMAEDGMSGRDLAALQDEILTLFGQEAQDTVDAWIARSPSRRLVLDEFRGAASMDSDIAQDDGKNHKGALLEHATAMKASVRFHDAARSGASHNPVFTSEVSWTLAGVVTTATGIGRTVKTAERAAARELGEKVGVGGTPSKVASVRTAPPKSQVMEEVQARPGSNVEFVESGTSGPPHARRFRVEARFALDGHEITGRGTGTTKKEAEHAASKDLLERLPPR